MENMQSMTYGNPVNSHPQIPSNCLLHNTFQSGCSGNNTDVLPTDGLRNNHQSFVSYNSQADVSASSQNQLHNVDAENLYRPVGVVERIQNHMKDISEVQGLCRTVDASLQQTTAGLNRLLKCTGGNIRVLDGYDMNQIVTAEQNRAIQELFNMRKSVIKNRKTLLDWHRERVFPRLKGLLSKVHHEIAEWQRAQAFAANGKYVESYDIDQLEDCCKTTVKLILLSLDQIHKLTKIEVNTVEEERQFFEALERLRVGYENLITEIVTFGLVLEKQPPQVLMKDKKFACRLRHLVSNSLDLHKFSFLTEATLVNCDVACDIKENGSGSPITKSGNIANSVKMQSDYNDDAKHVQVHMTNMMLKSIVRKSEADIVVTREKYCMVFRSQICLRLPHNNELNVTAQAMSLPIVVITHGKQEPDAHATIFWDNAFSNQFRRPFEVPSQVQWNWILDGLHWLWKKECEDESSVHMEGGGLSTFAIKYLTHKLFNIESVEPSTMVTWNKFNQDHLPDKGFTFWIWFFKAMELVSSNYVKKYWNLGLIHGFVGKASCQNMLLQRQLGTFIFRFSDTVPGSLSISYYDNYERGHEVKHLQPDTVNEFKNRRSIPDIVQDLDCLSYLYPDVPKDVAFGRLYTQAFKAVKGYIPKQTRTVVKDIHQQRQFSDRPLVSSVPNHLPNVQSPGSTSDSFLLSVSRHESFDSISNQDENALFAGSVAEPFSPNLSGRHESLEFLMETFP